MLKRITGYKSRKQTPCCDNVLESQIHYIWCGKQETDIWRIGFFSQFQPSWSVVVFFCFRNTSISENIGKFKVYHRLLIISRNPKMCTNGFENYFWSIYFRSKAVTVKCFLKSNKFPKNLSLRYKISFVLQTFLQQSVLLMGKTSRYTWIKS